MYHLNWMLLFMYHSQIWILFFFQYPDAPNLFSNVRRPYRPSLSTIFGRSWLTHFIGIVMVIVGIGSLVWNEVRAGWQLTQEILHWLKVPLIGKLLNVENLNVFFLLRDGQLLWQKRWTKAIVPFWCLKPHQ